MNNGLYAAYLGMRARQRALDTTANNIANASTAGFKADGLVYRTIEAEQRKTNAADDALTPDADAPKPTPPGVLTSGTTDFSIGSFQQTNRALDVALEGDGFLVVQTPRGERYTRAGNMTLDASGQLTTHSGDVVVGTRGAITVPPGEVTIAADGTVSVGNRTIDRLRLVRFDDPRAALVKEGGSLFASTTEAKPLEAASTRVHQGALETSNVNIITEMATMMQTNREFESLQKSVSTMMNDLARKVSNEIGRI